MAIVAGLTLGFVVGRLVALIVPISILGIGLVATLSSREWTATEIDIVGASAIALFAVLAGVGIRQLQNWYYDKRPGPPAPPFAPIPPNRHEKQDPDPPPGF